MAAPVFVANEVVTAVKMNSLPKGVLGYAEVTSSQTGISTVTDLTGLSVTVDVAASRRIKITGHTKLVKDGTANRLVLTVREGTTELQRIADNTFAANAVEVVSGAAIIAPSSGSHTYKLSLSAVSGTGGTDAGATFPAYILVEDIGGA